MDYSASGFAEYLGGTILPNGQLMPWGTTATWARVQPAKRRGGGGPRKARSRSPNGDAVSAPAGAGPSSAGAPAAESAQAAQAGSRAGAGGGPYGDRFGKEDEADGDEAPAAAPAAVADGEEGAEDGEISDFERARLEAIEKEKKRRELVDVKSRWWLPKSHAHAWLMEGQFQDEDGEDYEWTPPRQYKRYDPLAQTGALECALSNVEPRYMPPTRSTPPDLIWPMSPPASPKPSIKSPASKNPLPWKWKMVKRAEIAAAIAAAKAEAKAKAAAEAAAAKLAEEIRREKERVEREERALLAAEEKEREERRIARQLARQAKRRGRGKKVFGAKALKSSDAMSMASSGGGKSGGGATSKGGGGPGSIAAKSSASNADSGSSPVPMSMDKEERETLMSMTEKDGATLIDGGEEATTIVDGKQGAAAAEAKKAPQEERQLAMMMHVAKASSAPPAAAEAAVPKPPSRKPRPPSAREVRARSRALEAAKPPGTRAGSPEPTADTPAAPVALPRHFIGLEDDDAAPTPAGVASASVGGAAEALRTHGVAHPTVADAALQRIGELAESTTLSRADLLEEFTDAGGFVSIVRVMKSRTREEPLQARCCRALAALAEAEAGCQQASDAGAFAALQTALTTHASDNHVLRWAAIAVLRLTQNSVPRAQLAITEGVELALRAPPGGGVWQRVAPPSVAAKLELARRWLALHLRVFSAAQGRVGPIVAVLDQGGASVDGSDDGGAAAVEGSSSFGSRPPRSARTSKETMSSTVESGASLLFRAEALKQKLGMNLSKMGDSFYKWDVDGNGTVDRTEWYQALESLGFDEPTQVYDIVFNEFDADGTGQIDYGEYMLKMLRDALIRDRTRILDLFRQWDADHSGAVSKAEFRDGIRKAGFDAKEEDIDMIFDDLDVDRSGELEYNELQTKLQWLAGGEGRQRRTSTGYYDL